MRDDAGRARAGALARSPNVAARIGTRKVNAPAGVTLLQGESRTVGRVVNDLLEVAVGRGDRGGGALRLRVELPSVVDLAAKQFLAQLEKGVRLKFT